MLGPWPVCSCSWGRFASMLMWFLEGFSTESAVGYGLPSVLWDQGFSTGQCTAGQLASVSDQSKSGSEVKCFVAGS